MKTKNILFVLTLFLWMSCKTESSSSNNNATTPNETVTNSSSNKATDLDIKITSTEGSVLGSFDLNPIKIVSNNVTYTHKTKSNKHKFYANGTMKYEVKFKEDGLKLRDKNSKLLWKVKIYPDKIKISNNEENENAFVIKAYEDKVKVKQNEEELYKVKIKDNVIKINDKDAYTISSNQDSYIYAILAIKEISDEHKLFLLAELLNKL